VLTLTPDAQLILQFTLSLFSYDSYVYVWFISYIRFKTDCIFSSYFVITFFFFSYMTSAFYKIHELLCTTSSLEFLFLSKMYLNCQTRTHYYIFFFQTHLNSCFPIVQYTQTTTKKHTKVNQNNLIQILEFEEATYTQLVAQLDNKGFKWKVRKKKSSHATKNKWLHFELTKGLAKKKR
jgi:hypothetical protein